MSSFIEINEGEIISREPPYSVRISRYRVSYREGGEVMAVMDSEHAASSGRLHLHAATLRPVSGAELSMDCSALLQRVESALQFAGVNYVIEQCS